MHKLKRENELERCLAECGSGANVHIEWWAESLRKLCVKEDPAKSMRERGGQEYARNSQLWEAKI